MWSSNRLNRSRTVRVDLDLLRPRPGGTTPARLGLRGIPSLGHAASDRAGPEWTDADFDEQAKLGYAEMQLFALQVLEPDILTVLGPNNRPPFYLPFEAERWRAEVARFFRHLAHEDPDWCAWLSAIIVEERAGSRGPATSSVYLSLGSLAGA